MVGGKLSPGHGPLPQVLLAWCVQRHCGRRASQTGSSCARWTGISPMTGQSSARCGCSESSNQAGNSQHKAGPGSLTLWVPYPLGALLVTSSGSGRLPTTLESGLPVVPPKDLSLLSSDLQPTCNPGLASPFLGSMSFAIKWNNGCLTLFHTGYILQSLDAQPEQLALRPKEFFRAYGIEVLTEAQVQG